MRRLRIFQLFSMCATLAFAATAGAQGQLDSPGDVHSGHTADGGFSGLVNSTGGYSASVPFALPPTRDGVAIPFRVAFGGGGHVGAAGAGWDIPLSFIVELQTISGRKPLDTPGEGPEARRRDTVQVRKRMEIRTVDPLEWVRSSAGRFFPSGVPEPLHLLAYLMADVLELGGGACVIKRTGEWWVIGSDVDWLHDNRYTERELFARVVAAPSHGVHSMRGEILLAAFARSVWITLDGHASEVQGEEPPSSIWINVPTLHRAIAFAM